MVTDHLHHDMHTVPPTEIDVERPGRTGGGNFLLLVQADDLEIGAPSGGPDRVGEAPELGDRQADVFGADVLGATFWRLTRRAGASGIVRSFAVSIRMKSNAMDSVLRGKPLARDRRGSSPGPLHSRWRRSRPTRLDRCLQMPQRFRQRSGHSYHRREGVPGAVQHVRNARCAEKRLLVGSDGEHPGVAFRDGSLHSARAGAKRRRGQSEAGPRGTLTMRGSRSGARENAMRGLRREGVTWTVLQAARRAMRAATR